MKRVKIDMMKMKEAVELVDMQADIAGDEEREILDGLANLLDEIVSGRVVCFYKDDNGNHSS